MAALSNPLGYKAESWIIATTFCTFHTKPFNKQEDLKGSRALSPVYHIRNKFLKTRCVCETLCPLLQFWLVYLTFDLEGWPWHWPYTTQNVQVHEIIHMHAKYQVAMLNIAEDMAKMSDFDPYNWPLTLKDDLDLTPLKMCRSMRYTCMPNTKLLCWILQKLWPKWVILTHIIDLWPWRMTLTFQHSKCAAPLDTHACRVSSCYVEYCKSYGQC